MARARFWQPIMVVIAFSEVNGLACRRVRYFGQGRGAVLLRPLAFINSLIDLG